jgi:hypothetical protein
LVPSEKLYRLRRTRVVKMQRKGILSKKKHENFTVILWEKKIQESKESKFRM